ncbi:uncharacterized protein LOC116256993 isoform X1 [Nymphaea colorata]|nr:uncharacterized protein LOC116256993 isoform X1 [Nymphaea colorata]
MASRSPGSTPGSVPTPDDGGRMYERSPGGTTGSCENPSPGRPRGVCFSCGKSGHWYRQCTERGSRNLRTPESPTGDGLVGKKLCRCGGGPCLVLTSHTSKNPGRKFYKCPVKTPGMNCQLFEWCDSPSPSSVAIDFSLYPMCACGAGRAKLSLKRDGPYAGKHCFICPIKKGQGACNFLQLDDQPMKDKKISDAPGDSNRVVEIGDALPYGRESNKYNGETLTHGDSNVVVGTGDALPYGEESEEYNGEALIHGDSNEEVGTGNALPYGKENDEYNGETPLIHGDSCIGVGTGETLLLRGDSSLVVGTGDALPYGKKSNEYNGETLLIHGSDRDESSQAFPSVCPQPAAGTACGEESERPRTMVPRKLNFEDSASALNPPKSKPGNCYKCGRPGYWVIDCLSHN